MCKIILVDASVMAELYTWRHGFSLKLYWIDSNRLLITGWERRNKSDKKGVVVKELSPNFYATMYPPQLFTTQNGQRQLPLASLSYDTPTELTIIWR